MTVEKIGYAVDYGGAEPTFSVRMTRREMRNIVNVMFTGMEVWREEEREYGDDPAFSVDKETWDALRDAYHIMDEASYGGAE